MPEKAQKRRAQMISKQTYIFSLEPFIISITTRLRLLFAATMNFCWDFNDDPFRRDHALKRRRGSTSPAYRLMSKWNEQATCQESCHKEHVMPRYLWHREQLFIVTWSKGSCVVENKVVGEGMKLWNRGIVDGLFG